MKTIEEVKEALSSDKQQSEVIEILLDAEKLRRRINEYLKKDRHAQTGEHRREILADASEDIYTVEHSLAQVVGRNIVESIIEW